MSVELLGPLTNSTRSTRHLHSFLSSAILWLRGIDRLAVPLYFFFQGGGVRLKAGNIGIPLCACRLSWIMVASCGEYPIRRFPAPSDLTRLPLPKERSPTSVNQADSPCQTVANDSDYHGSLPSLKPINTCVLCHSFLSHVRLSFTQLHDTNI